MLKDIEELKNKIICIKPFIKNEKIKNYSELVTTFNSLILKLDSFFNPEEEWLQDNEFARIFNIWEESVSNGNKLNSARKKACLIELKKITENDKDLAKEVLINAAKYATMKFNESIKAVPKRKAKKQQNDKTTNNKKNISQILKTLNIKLIAQTNNSLTVKGNITPFSLAKLRKETGLNILIEK